MFGFTKLNKIISSKISFDQQALFLFNIDNCKNLVFCIIFSTLIILNEIIKRNQSPFLEIQVSNIQNSLELMLVICLNQLLYEIFIRNIFDTK